MPDSRRSRKGYFNFSLNPYTIFSDLIKSVWVIVSLSLSFACFSYIYRIETYSPYYSVSVTYMVTSRGVNNDLITAIPASQENAVRFTEILNSTELYKQVSSDTGINVDNIYARASRIGETNLVELIVYGNTPQYAFTILQSIIDNYSTISSGLITNASISMLLSPSVSGKPGYVISPWRTMLKFFGIAIAALTFLFAVISTMKDTIRAGKDVEKKLDTDYLGELPSEKKPRKRRRGKNRAGDSILILRNKISLRYEEAVERISRKVQYKMSGKGLKTLLVTSCLENEGKSTVAANLALSLAEQGLKTALVDLDLRKPAQYKIFEVTDPESCVLGDVLTGKKGLESCQRIIEKTEVTGLFNAKEYSNSTEIITSGSVRNLLLSLRDSFDYIIVDTPPMSLAADAEMIADFTDASMMVAREHMARAREINDNLDILYECKADVLGCVVNNVHISATSQIGGKGFNRHYDYTTHYGHGDYIE